MRTTRGDSCSFFPEKRTMVRPALAQPCATAHQPNLVALKTRLFIRAFIWFPGLLARLFLFHVLFLSFVVPYRVLSVHETGRMRCSDSLARQSLLIEMISFHAIRYNSCKSPLGRSKAKIPPPKEQREDLGAKRGIGLCRFKLISVRAARTD